MQDLTIWQWTCHLATLKDGWSSATTVVVWDINCNNPWNHLRTAPSVCLQSWRRWSIEDSYTTRVTWWHGRRQSSNGHLLPHTQTTHIHLTFIAVAVFDADRWNDAAPDNLYSLHRQVRADDDKSVRFLFVNPWTDQLTNRSRPTSCRKIHCQSLDCQFTNQSVKMSTHLYIILNPGT